MAAAGDTVELLNKVAGKTSSPNRKRVAIDPAELSFTPAKRQARGLQYRQGARVNSTATGRRSSFSLPNDDESKTRLRPVHKRTRQLIGKAKTTVNESPLKSLGFDAEIPLPDPKVNLNESPSKNTRSQKANPLEKLSKTVSTPRLLPANDDASRRTTRLSLQRGEAAPLLPMHENINKPKSPESRRRSTKTAASQVAEENDAGSESEQEEQHNTRDNQSDVHNTVSNATTTTAQPTDQEGLNPQPARPQKVRSSKKAKESTQKQSEPDPSDEEAEPSSSSPARQRRTTDLQRERAERKKRIERDNLKLLLDAEEDRMEHLKTKFIRNIMDAVGLHGLTQSWAAVGAAALWIGENYQGDPRSVRGGGVLRPIHALTDVYRHQYKHGDPDANDWKDDANNILSKIERRCQLLQFTSRKAEDSNQIRDIYKFIIPAMIQLLKAFLKSHFHGEMFAGDALDVFARLLDVAVEICDIATTWPRRPTNLENGVKQLVRAEILPALRDIQRAFTYDKREEERKLQAEKWRDREKAATERLQNLQIARLQAIELKRQQAFSRRHTLATSQSVEDQDRSQSVFDIDDLELVTATKGMGQSFDTATPDADISHRPQIQRQPTEEIPAPPLESWQDEENTALLNGLQHFQTGNRYEDILNSYDVLRKRDVDELVAQARYFKQVMAGYGSKPPVDDSLSWLLTVS